MVHGRKGKRLLGLTDPGKELETTGRSVGFHRTERRKVAGHPRHPRSENWDGIRGHDIFIVFSDT